MEKVQLHLLFVCVSNRGRSVFAEFFFRKIISELENGLFDRVKVTSAGFIPQAIRDHVAELQIGIPEPFYNRPVAETTRAFLSERGIVVPPDWRSRELTSEMVEEANLIITAIPEQKEDLLKLYPEAEAKIVTVREISRWHRRLRFEDLSTLPGDSSYWNYVEEDADYVKTILSEMEESLTQALPHIFRNLGCGE
ncbi:MAG: hypothetical protein ACLP5H_06640 [Desulfomonilaceae bacterium]